jgi:hypothetical protein
MTEEERYNRLDEKLDKILDKLNEKMEKFDAKLQDHESRIIVLEVHDKSDEGKADWKTQLLMLLGKAIVISGVVIASLAGAGSLLPKIMGS